MDIAYLRNKTASRGVPGYNLDDCEPSGRYLTADTIPNQPAPAGWERGTVSFVNPLRLEHLHGGWRQALSAHYDGRTGRELTASLRADGYDGIITADYHGYGEIVALQMNEVAPWFKGVTHEEIVENDRKNKENGPRDPYDFTGSPETQYHHRALDDDDLEDIETRHDSADDWYAEMATRRAQGLPEIDWNTWINKRISYRLAMAWDEWAPKIKGDCSGGGCASYGQEGRYVVPQAGAFLHYKHTNYLGKPALHVIGIYTHPDNRNDGVAEALMRRLSEDHPGVPINPGYMTPDGQRFHDRMLEKEPSARELVTAVRLAMAWDEWAPKIEPMTAVHAGDRYDYVPAAEKSCKDCKDDGLKPGRYYWNEGNSKWDYNGGKLMRYVIKHHSTIDPGRSSSLAFGHHRDDDGPYVAVHMIETDPMHRRDGVAESLMRRLHDDHPGIRINPGGMSPDGKGFHDRMLEKEPDARALVTAMAWPDWALKVKHDYDDFGDGAGYGSFYVEHESPIGLSQVTYYHRPDEREIAIGTLHTERPYRHDGVAEALMRKLHETYPDHAIIPGGMSNDGRAFHDRMLEKEPEARELVTAASLLVGPYDAYDENDWFQRHMDHPPLEDPVTADWYHVSPHRMQVGTILAPMRGETPWDDEPYDNGLQNRANWIWIEYDERKAREWQQWVLKHQPQCRLYRVQPHLGPFAWNGTADEGWVTDWAEILEEMT
jgi:GNAT superfamily N-acetyltransferase